jgi:hypothetical protein
MKNIYSYESEESHTPLRLAIIRMERIFWCLIFAGVPIALLVQSLLPAVGKSIYRLDSSHFWAQLSFASVVAWFFNMFLALWAGGFLNRRPDRFLNAKP